MDEEYTVRGLALSLPFERRQLTDFLARHHLKYEADIQAAYGIFDAEDRLFGCGCCAGNLLKCFAVDEKLRGQNALGTLVSKLVENRFQAGITHLFVVTRPKNQALFQPCGFFPVAGTETVILLENRRDGISRFYRSFRLPEDAGTPCGAVVMNCNPFTLGHRALIEYAAAHCPLLHIFVVEEDRSAFPFPDRLRLVTEGTADLPNVRVHPSGPYIISSASFPTYFLKENEAAAAVQAELDITIFAQKIAPVLGISVRFAGEEPLDPVTRQYNAAMRTILPAYGIEFMEIPRRQRNGEAISASQVRRLLRESGVTEPVLALVPPCTQAYLREHAKQYAAAAITPPKG